MHPFAYLYHDYMPAKKKTAKAKKITKAEKPALVLATEVVKEIKHPQKEKYFYAVGRRKSAVAQIKLYPSGKAGENDLVVNKKKMKEYFRDSIFQNIFLAPLKATGNINKFKIDVLAKGGGFRGQVEAIRLAISRALVKFNEEFKKPLRNLGFLTRDARVVERKKPGLKKARKAPQWAKR